MNYEHKQLIDKMVDIRNLFDDADRKAEGHGMDDLACCPVSVACYAENKIKRQSEDIEKLNEIKKVMGLSHADSFNIQYALQEIKNILEFN